MMESAISSKLIRGLSRVALPNGECPLNFQLLYLPDGPATDEAIEDHSVALDQSFHSRPSFKLRLLINGWHQLAFVLKSASFAVVKPLFQTIAT